MGEPSAAIIQPPKPIDVSASNLSHEFRRWKDMTMLYLRTQDFKDRPAAKAATVLYLAGPRMVEIAQQFTYGSMESQDDSEVVMSKIEAYCNPKKNETLERNRFWKAEFDGSFEEFLSKITRLADTCGFKDKNDMIRDKIEDSVLSPKQAVESPSKRREADSHQSYQHMPNNIRG